VNARAARREWFSCWICGGELPPLDQRDHVSTCNGPVCLKAMRRVHDLVEAARAQVHAELKTTAPSATAGV
jgi:hypothetical protein